MINGPSPFIMVAMYGGKDTLYEVLGVHRSAQPGDIVRAYRAKRTQLLVGSAPDDPQGVLVHEAYEVLSDPQKRAAYDASLRGDAFLRPERAFTGKGPKYGLIAAAVVVVIALLAWWRFSAGPAEAIPQEIVARVATAVGRVERLDMQGRSLLLGHAFAIDPGVMVTSCNPAVANTQLVVSFGTRRASAQSSQPDKRKPICRLAVVSAGSWPLGISRDEPKVGEKVYAAIVKSNGDADIIEGKVKALLPAEGGRAIEFSVPVLPAMEGAPLLDADGRVIGMMSLHHAFGAGRSIALPAAWVAALRAEK
jgi:hypothetical protein